MSGPREIEGFVFRFERRRYGGRRGGQTYTWAYVQTPGGQYLSLGDPWPCIVPARKALVAEAQRRLEGYHLGQLDRARMGERASSLSWQDLCPYPPSGRRDGYEVGWCEHGHRGFDDPSLANELIQLERAGNDNFKRTQ